jgi:hypothetical protein
MSIFDSFDSFVDAISPPIGEFFEELGDGIGVLVTDPLKVFRDAIANPSSILPGFGSILSGIIPKISIPNPLEFMKEAISSIAQIIKGVADSIIDKVDVVLNSAISKVQAGLVAVADKFETVATNIINTASNTYQDLLRKTIEGLKSVIDKVFQEIRTTLGQLDSIVEARVNQIGNIIATSLDKITRIADTYTPGKIYTDLVSPTLKEISKLEKTIFEDVNNVLDKIVDNINQKSLDFKNHVNLEIILRQSRAEAKAVLTRMRLTEGDVRSSDINQYEFLKEFSEDRIARDNTISVQERLRSYAEIQENAAIMKFITVIPIPNRETFFASEFLKYGVLFRETEKFLPS